MNSIGDRVKTLRKSLNLSLTAFGKRVGLAAPMVLRIEQGSTNVTKAILKSICSEFNVSYDWITKGEGPIFATTPISSNKPALEQLAEEYHLSDADKVILKTFLELPTPSRLAIQNALKTIDATMIKEAKTAAKTKNTKLTSKPKTNGKEVKGEEASESSSSEKETVEPSTPNEASTSVTPSPSK